MQGEDFIKEQMAHEATNIWLSLVGKYAKLSKYKLALDIGTGSGLTAWAIANAGKGKIVSIDPKMKGMERELAKSFKYIERIKFYKVTSDDYFAEKGDTYDLIIIDGDHSYNAVLNDLNNAWSVLKEDGYIVCDDFDRYTDVANAVEEFGQEFIVEEGKAIFKK